MFDTRSTAGTLILIVATIACGACGTTQEASVPPAPPIPAASALPSDDASTNAIIRELEERVRANPDDFMAFNKLAGYYHRRLRETGDIAYVDLAMRAARSSLDVLPADWNPGGLGALVQAELAAHEFASARDHALELTRLDPNKSLAYAMLGDALIELGDYEKGAEALHEAERRAGGEPSIAVETRLARLAALQGRPDDTEKHFSQALVLALDEPNPDRETVAWCRWQLGETAFSAGRLEVAERHYRDALETFPGYHRALASLGRTLAGAGDLPAAIQSYEQAIQVIPDPTYVAALGDLYRMTGREREAAAQYALVDQIAKANERSGALYNRQYALYLADHDLKPEEAYAAAAREYEQRRDIYGADAVAWTALKAGRIEEAKRAIDEALKLGTKDARLLYHAGMIARAAGDASAARGYLERSLALNPHFDPRGATLAQEAFDELSD